MKLEKIPGLIVLKPKIFEDNRGSFFETYNRENLNNFANKKLMQEESENLKNEKTNDIQLLKTSVSKLIGEFLQDNQSISNKNVLRGLHFQNPPFEQGKLLRVPKGSIMDIAVDIRKDSPYYGKYFSIILSDKNNLTLWIPPGFAHGFLTLEDNTIFIYKCTQVYNKESEGAILWDDPDLNINWLPDSNMQLPVKPLVSEKDQKASKFKDLNSKF